MTRIYRPTWFSALVTGNRHDPCSPSVATTTSDPLALVLQRTRALVCHQYLTNSTASEMPMFSRLVATITIGTKGLAITDSTTNLMANSTINSTTSSTANLTANLTTEASATATAIVAPHSGKNIEWCLSQHNSGNQFVVFDSRLKLSIVFSCIMFGSGEHWCIIKSLVYIIKKSYSVTCSRLSIIQVHLTWTSTFETISRADSFHMYIG